MKSALLIASLLFASPAFADGIVIDIHFPAPPTLVLIEPGIQVVPDYDGEVFFTTGFYWIERDGHWYRTADHRGGWTVVERVAVPGGLVVLPKGKYRHHPGHGGNHGDGDRSHEKKDKKEKKDHGGGHGRGK